MRICIVSQEYPPETGGGGIGTQSYLKAQGLSARGHHVEVVSASWENPRDDHDGKVIVHRIKPSDFGVEPIDESMQWMSYSLSIAQKLNEMQVEDNFDIIQFPEYVGEGFFHQINNFQYRRARYSVQLHGPLAMFAEYMRWPEKSSTAYSVGCFMEKSVIHHADGILASSHNTAAFCAQFYGYPVERINVIHSGIDVDKFAPPVEAGRDQAFPKILFVGNFVGAKGFNLLIDAVLHLRGRYPNICLRMIGKEGDEQVKNAKNRLLEADAEKNVQFLHYVPYAELPKHYAWCDLFAGPSMYEPGPGNVYLEAMSCARPVIACNSAGAPEVVLDGRTGLLVPPENLAALEQAIMALADDQSLRQRLGDEGRRWVCANFSIEKYIDKVESFYQQLLDRAPNV